LTIRLNFTKTDGIVKTFMYNAFLAWEMMYLRNAKEMQDENKIQDGSRRHLDFLEITAISQPSDQCSPQYIGMSSRYQYRTQLFHCKQYVATKCKMAAIS